MITVTTMIGITMTMTTTIATNPSQGPAEKAGPWPALANAQSSLNTLRLLSICMARRRLAFGR